MQTKSLPALSAEQRIVAENQTDSILLLAGAGTGKTTCLARRVAHLISSGAAASGEILCLTFTNRACREMHERIEAIAGEAAADTPVRTMHAFCADLLRTAPREFSELPPNFGVCDPADALELIREAVCETLGRSIAEAPARILQAFVSLVKDCRLDRPELDNAQAAAWLCQNRSDAVALLCTPRSEPTDEKFLTFLCKYGGSVARMYDRRLLACGLLDFSDLLLHAGALLRNPDAAALLAGRYRFVHVDEVQDVSLAEYDLVRRIAGNAVVLFCGDFHQTIYQWRGSDPDRLIERFRADYSPVTVAFSHNYRSSPDLLALAQNFRANAFGGEPPSGFDPYTTSGGDVCFAVCESPAEEAAWICRQLAKLQVTDFSRVAVIARTNRACAELCELLAQAAQDMPADPPLRFMLADETRLFSQPQVRDLLAILRLLANPQDGSALSRVLLRLTPGVGAATRDKMLAGLRGETGAALTDLLDLRTRATGDFFAPLTVALDGGKVVVFDVESTGTDVYSDEIIQIAAIRLAPDGNVAARFERFLRSDRPVGDSERVHGFSDAFLLENGIPPIDALDEFLDFASDCVIVGHNVMYDLTITAQNLLLRGSDRVFAPVFYDTLSLARRFLPRLPNHKLATVSAALETAHTPSHDAMDDILATADVLWLLHQGHILPQTEPRRAFYRAHLPRLTELGGTLASLTETLHTPVVGSPVGETADGTSASALGGVNAAAAAAETALPALCRACANAFGLWAQCNSATAERSLRLFLELAGDLCESALPLARQLSDLLELTSLSPNELALMGRTTQKIAVVTAHQSKGCEYDIVFLPMLQEGVFPVYLPRGKSDSEEARVFYVALTRAKQKLFCSHAQYNAEHRKNRPSRFLALLSPAPDT